MVDEYMFPADAGMNRFQFAGIGLDVDVPRGRGDEPKIDEAPDDAILCSPRTRG
jgi:hypothetical protein